MAMFQIYFDESGKFKDQKIVSFCGVCAPVSRMQKFEDEWNGILRRYEMRGLTMKKALRPTVGLSKVIRPESIPQRIESLKPFADCIRENLELGVATAIDVDGYADLSVEAKKRLGGSDNPHYMAFLCGIVAVTSYVSKDDRISLICDDDEETAWNCYKFYRRVRKIEPGARQRLVALSFADDKEFVSLQAADFLSSLVRLEAYRQFVRRPYDYRRLFEYLTRQGSKASKIRWAVSFYNKEKLNDMSPILEKTAVGTR